MWYVDYKTIRNENEGITVYRDDAIVWISSQFQLTTR